MAQDNQTTISQLDRETDPSPNDNVPIDSVSEGRGKRMEIRDFIASARPKKTPTEVKNTTMEEGEVWYTTLIDRLVIGPKKRMMASLTDTGIKRNNVAELEGDEPGFFEKHITASRDATPKRDVLGFHGPNDRAWLPMLWDEGRPKSDHNGGAIISPTWNNGVFADAQNVNWHQSDPNDTGNGCWILMYDQLEVIHFGAKPNDSSFDDTNAFRAALKFSAREGVKCHAKEGEFITDHIDITLQADENLIFEGGGIGNTRIKRKPDSVHGRFDRMFMVFPHASTKTVDIRGFYFDGNRRNQPDVLSDPDAYAYGQSPIVTVQTNLSHVVIKDCWFKDPVADSIWLAKQKTAVLENLYFEDRNAVRSDILLRDVGDFKVSNVFGLENGSNSNRIEIENQSAAPALPAMKGSFENIHIGEFEISGVDGNNKYLDLYFNNIETYHYGNFTFGTFRIRDSKIKIAKLTQLRKMRQMDLKVYDSEFIFQHDSGQIYGLSTNSSGPAPNDVLFDNVHFGIEQSGSLLFSSDFDSFVQILGDETENNKFEFIGCTFDERIPINIDNFGGILKTKENEFAARDYGVYLRSRTINNFGATWKSHDDRLNSGKLALFGTASNTAKANIIITGDIYDSYQPADFTINSGSDFTNHFNTTSQRRFIMNTPPDNGALKGDEVTVINGSTVEKYVSSNHSPNVANWVKITP